VLAPGADDQPMALTMEPMPMADCCHMTVL
jgi:hypothetical protein